MNLTQEDKEITVLAELVSEDGEYRVPFNAVPWLARASVYAIRNCIISDYRGWRESHLDYAEDDIAYFCRELNGNADLDEAIIYCEEMGVGFDVYISSCGALSWLNQHRPDLLMR